MNFSLDELCIIQAALKGIHREVPVSPDAMPCFLITCRKVDRLVESCQDQPDLPAAPAETAPPTPEA